MNPARVNVGPKHFHRLSILAILALILGALTPVRMAFEWSNIWGVMNLFGWIERYGFSLLVGETIKLGLGGLGAWAGWGLFKRRPWAALLGCIAAGCILVDSGTWLYGLAFPSLRVIAGAFTPKYARVVVTMGAPVLVHSVTFGCWLMILYRLLRTELRTACDLENPEYSSRTLWITLGLSAGLYGLLMLLQNLMWSATPPTH